MDETRTTELNKALEGMWDSLTDEQKEQAKACETLDELMALAGREGIELPDELLEEVAGGKTPTSAWSLRRQYALPGKC